MGGTWMLLAHCGISCPLYKQRIWYAGWPRTERIAAGGMQCEREPANVVVSLCRLSTFSLKHPAVLAHPLITMVKSVARLKDLAGGFFRSGDHFL